MKEAIHQQKNTILMERLCELKDRYDALVAQKKWQSTHWHPNNQHTSTDSLEPVIRVDNLFDSGSPDAIKSIQQDLDDANRRINVHLSEIRTLKENVAQLDSANVTLIKESKATQHSAIQQMRQMQREHLLEKTDLEQQVAKLCDVRSVSKFNNIRMPALANAFSLSNQSNRCTNVCRYMNDMSANVCCIWNSNIQC